MQTSVPGAMAACEADTELVAAIIAPWRDVLSIAAENAPDQVVISGTADASAARPWRSPSSGVTPLPVPAGSLPLIDPLLDAFGREARRRAPRAIWRCVEPLVARAAGKSRIQSTAAPTPRPSGSGRPSSHAGVVSASDRSSAWTRAQAARNRRTNARRSQWLPRCGPDMPPRRSSRVSATCSWLALKWTGGNLRSGPVALVRHCRSTRHSGLDIRRPTPPADRAVRARRWRRSFDTRASRRRRRLSRNGCWCDAGSGFTEIEADVRAVCASCAAADVALATAGSGASPDSPMALRETRGRDGRGAPGFAVHARPLTRRRAISRIAGGTRPRLAGGALRAVPTCTVSLPDSAASGFSSGWRQALGVTTLSMTAIRSVRSPDPRPKPERRRPPPRCSDAVDDAGGRRREGVCKGRGRHRDSRLLTTFAHARAAANPSANEFQSAAFDLTRDIRFARVLSRSPPPGRRHILVVVQHHCLALVAGVQSAS